MFKRNRWLVVVGGMLLAAAFLGCGGEDEPAGDSAPSAGDATANAAGVTTGGAPAETNGGGAGKSAGGGEPDADIFAGKPEPPIQVMVVKREKVASTEDADKQIKAVREVYNNTKVPEVLQPPYSREATRQYLVALKHIKAQREADLAWLKAIDVEKLTAGDKIALQNLGNLRDNLLSRLETYLPKELEYSEKNTREILAQNLQRDIDFLKKGADADPTKDSDVKNVLTAEAIMRLRDQAIDRLAGVVPVAELLDAELDVKSEWPTKKEEIRTMVAQYRRNVRAAAGSVKPPQDIGDAELTKIATQVLTDPKLGLPQAERIIVNIGKQPKNRTEYIVDVGTVTKVVRRWDEFQAATIEKAKNGKYYLYFNDILYYHEGPNTVPLNKWVLGPRFQSAPILEENIGK